MQIYISGEEAMFAFKYFEYALSYAKFSLSSNNIQSTGNRGIVTFSKGSESLRLFVY